MNFQEDVALQCSRHDSLVSLDNESQDEDDDDDDDGDGEDDNDSSDDDRSLSVPSTVGLDHSEVTDVATSNDTTTPLLYQLLHTLNMVRTVTGRKCLL